MLLCTSTKKYIMSGCLFFGDIRRLPKSVNWLWWQNGDILPFFNYRLEYCCKENFSLINHLITLWYSCRKKRRINIYFPLVTSFQNNKLIFSISQTWHWGLCDFPTQNHFELLDQNKLICFCFDSLCLFWLLFYFSYSILYKYINCFWIVSHMQRCFHIKLVSH